MENMTKNDKKTTIFKNIVRFYLKILHFDVILIMRERRRLCTIRRLPKS